MAAYSTKFIIFEIKFKKSFRILNSFAIVNVRAIRVMVLPAPECSECTRQNGISILSNGTIEYIFNEADPFYNYTCPEGYRCWSEDDSILELLNLSNLNWSNLNVSITGTNKGCCVPCAQEFACPEVSDQNLIHDSYSYCESLGWIFYVCQWQQWMVSWR